jgi:hypothetical protein
MTSFDISDAEHPDVPARATEICIDDDAFLV